MYKLVEKSEYADLVTFIPNKYEPVYNWLYFKEGFSRKLVFDLLGRFELDENSVILDPFCGVGTTNLACKQLGYDNIGFDVSPLCIFSARVKMRNYDVEELKEMVKSLLKEKFRKPLIETKDPITKRAFSRFALEDIVFFRNRILEENDEKMRDFLLLALIDSSIKCSYAFKDGAVIKIRKRHVPPVREMLRRRLYAMIRDLENFEKKEIDWRIDFGNARKLDLEDRKIDCIITSPPYLNKIEYTKIYRIELDLFFDYLGIKEMERKLVHSYMGLEEKDVELDEEINEMLGNNPPLVAKKYFYDMNLVLNEFHRVCKKNAFIAIVVGNGCFPDRVIESDIIISRQAEKLGFNIEKIWVANKRWCTRNRTKKVGIARESIILMKN